MVTTILGICFMCFVFSSPVMFYFAAKQGGIKIDPRVAAAIFGLPVAFFVCAILKFAFDVFQNAYPINGIADQQEMNERIISLMCWGFTLWLARRIGKQSKCVQKFVKS